MRVQHLLPDIKRATRVARVVPPPGAMWRALLDGAPRLPLYEEMAHQADVIAALSLFFRQPKSDAARLVSERFVEKYPTWFHPTRLRFESRAVTWLTHLTAMMTISDRRILDVGCGYGLAALLMSIGGAAEVVGVDRSRHKIRDFTRLVACAGTPNVIPVLGDFRTAVARVPAFDVVVANCFLSHLEEDETFLSFCKAVLKPGGQIWLYDDNNAWSPIRRLTVLRDWWKAELLGEGRHESSFLSLRRRVIRSHLPRARGLSGWLREGYAAVRTRGLTQKDIESFCRSLADGTPRRPPAARFPFRHPITGVCEERLLRPGMLARRLRELGFESNLFPRPPSGTSETAWSFVRCLICILHVLRPEFELMATLREPGRNAASAHHPTR